MKGVTPAQFSLARLLAQKPWAVPLGSFGPAGHITVNQMYVRSIIPQSDRDVPAVMLHGMTHTGKAWETTPDGRMGWDEYSARKGHPVYVPDQLLFTTDKSAAGQRREPGT